MSDVAAVEGVGFLTCEAMYFHTGPFRTCMATNRMEDDQSINFISVVDGLHSQFQLILPACFISVYNNYINKKLPKLIMI